MVATIEGKRRIGAILRRLREQYPDAECALRFDSPLQLLVATILSAQCTDKQVNLVTPKLFARFKTAADFAKAPLPVLERMIQSTGFFRNKAKNIRDCCRLLVERHKGVVPRELDALVELPGIGRKTANVVLGTAYGIASGVVVDTHIGRIARRLGLAKHSDPVKVEQDLCRVVPRKEWIAFGHRMIAHGRAICTARSPRCPECPLLACCPRIGLA